MKNIIFFYFQFSEVKFSTYLNKRVFVMIYGEVTGQIVFLLTPPPPLKKKKERKKKTTTNKQTNKKKTKTKKKKKTTQHQQTLKGNARLEKNVFRMKDLAK